MSTVIPMNTEQRDGEDDPAPERFGVTAETLRTRRSEIALLEARCGHDPDEIEFSRGRAWLFPTAAVLLGAGFASAFPAAQPVLTAMAAMGLGVWAASAAFQSSRALRLLLVRRDRLGRRFLTDAGLWVAQIFGAVALAQSLAPSPVAAALLGAGGLIALGAGWLAGKTDPRRERMREDLQEAREQLSRDEAAFEREIDAARSEFDAQIARARRAAGIDSPGVMAAE